jgi:all-trans-retinol 13,14-reductase
MSDVYDPTYATSRRVKSTPPTQVDVAIVGAGLGGLVAGATLARAGLSVACFDQHYVAGGCATQFARGGPKARFNFDIGLHYIGDCGSSEGVIPSILDGLGVNVDFVPMDPEGFDTLVFPDFEFPIPADIGLYRDRLVDRFPEEKKGIDYYIQFVRQVHRVGRVMDRSGGRKSWSVVAEVMLRGRKVLKHQRQTMAEVLERVTKNPQLRGVILGQNGDYGLPPSEVSALLHVGLSVHYLRGAYYPKGGGQVLADGIAEAMEKAGGSIHLRRAVSEILVEGGKVVGVRTQPHKGESEDIRAGVVISNADLQRTMLELVDPVHMPAESRQRAQQFKMAAAIYMTCLGVRGDLRELGMTNTNYWQFDDYDMEAYYTQLRSGGAPEPRCAYITSASLKDPDSLHHAPTGHQTLEIMTVLSGEPSVWGVSGSDLDRWGYKKHEVYSAHKDRIEEALIDRAERRFPGLRDRIVFQESATPMTHSRYTWASKGTGYGIASTPDQMFEGRPGYRGPLPGLYLCGASTRAGHGIIGAMQSGLIAAKKVLSDRRSRS